MHPAKNCDNMLLALIVMVHFHSCPISSCVRNGMCNCREKGKWSQNEKGEEKQPNFYVDILFFFVVAKRGDKKTNAFDSGHAHK